ncbi:MAG: hemolysin III family protein [Pirellulaceae bacterium]
MLSPELASNRPDGPPDAIHEMAERGERLNTLTHGFGLMLSIVATVILLRSSLASGDTWRVIGCGVFAAGLIAVYAASTLSHGVSHRQWKHWFRMFDQGLIYILITATYTPFSLAYLRQPHWWAFLGVMWIAALSGFIAKVFFVHRINAVTVWSYLLLGWLPMVPAIFAFGTVPPPAVGWLLAGGVCYTLGTIFLIVDLQRYHFHAIWHLWVIVGSTCHFLSVLFFVAHLTTTG